MNNFNRKIFIYFFMLVSCSQNNMPEVVPGGISVDADSVSIQIEKHIATVNKLRYAAPDSAFILVQKAESLSMKLTRSPEQTIREKGLRYLGKSYNFRGVINSNIGNYNEALNLHRQALEIYEKTGDKQGMGDSHNDMGHAYMLSGQYTDALNHYIRYMEICREIDFTHGIGQAYGNMGIIYFYQENYPKALENYQKHYEIAEKNRNSYELIVSLNNIGEVFDKMDEYEKSAEYYRKGVAIADSAVNLYMAAYLLCNLGQVEQKMNRPAEAMKLYKQSLAIREPLNDNEGIAIVLNRMASLYLQQKQALKAVELSEKALRISKEYNILVEIKNAYDNLFQAYDILGNYREAYQYHTLYKAYSDSLFKNARNNEVAELEIQYKTREKEQQISLLTEQEKIRVLELKRSRMSGFFLGITAILVILIAAMLYRRNQLKTRMNNQLEILNTRLSESEKHLKELNNTKDRFFSILAHDMKSPLIAFRSITASLSENYEHIPPHQLVYYIEDMKKSAVTLVDLFNNLLTWSLSQTNRIDFSPTEINLPQITGDVLDLYAGEISKKRLVIKNNVPENLTAFADENMIATVIRNLFSNAVKFTPEYGKITINASKSENFIKFCISDGGPGLSPEDQAKLFRIDVKNREIGSGENKGTGLGLILCKEFINKNGGDIGVESKPGKGCTFWFTLKMKDS